jgi:surfactin synthase thioesterase subunit
MIACSLPIAVLAAANKIDSTWTLACNRADEAGKGLAKTLLEASSGNRPVTLIGFSMGARVIYSCLMELGKEQIEWEKRRVEAAEMTKRINRGSKAAKASRAVSRRALFRT